MQPSWPTNLQIRCSQPLFLPSVLMNGTPLVHSDQPPFRLRSKNARNEPKTLSTYKKWHYYHYHQGINVPKDQLLHPMETWLRRNQPLYWPGNKRLQQTNCHKWHHRQIRQWLHDDPDCNWIPYFCWHTRRVQKRQIIRQHATPTHQLHPSF